MTMGEMSEQIACYQISQGIAKEKAADEKYIPDLR